MQPNIRIEQTSAVVTIFTGSKIWGKAEQKQVPTRPSAGRIGSSSGPLVTTQLTAGLKATIVCN
jgi:hypothetical protein